MYDYRIILYFIKYIVNPNFKKNQSKEKYRLTNKQATQISIYKLKIEEKILVFVTTKYITRWLVFYHENKNETKVSTNKWLYTPGFEVHAALTTDLNIFNIFHRESVRRCKKSRERDIFNRPNDRLNNRWRQTPDRRWPLRPLLWPLPPIREIEDLVFLRHSFSCRLTCCFVMLIFFWISLWIFFLREL